MEKARCRCRCGCCAVQRLIASALCCAGPAEGGLEYGRSLASQGLVGHGGMAHETWAFGGKGPGAWGGPLGACLCGVERRGKERGIASRPRRRQCTQYMTLLPNLLWVISC